MPIGRAAAAWRFGAPAEGHGAAPGDDALHDRLALLVLHVEARDGQVGPEHLQVVQERVPLICANRKRSARLAPPADGGRFLETRRVATMSRSDAVDTGEGAMDSGAPLPHLCRDWAQPLQHLQRGRGTPCHCHICAGTGLRPCHICAGTRHTPPHLRWDWAQPLPHLRRDWAHPSACAALDAAG